MSRSYVFTLNNYSFNNFIEMWELLPKIRYIVFGAEIAPTTGTKHLQGYLELFKPQRYSWFKNTALERGRFDKRKGTRDEARNYCIKKDGDYFEYGHWESGGQGARTDLHKVIELIKKDEPLIKIMEEMPEIVSKNMRFVEKYQQLVEKESTKKFRNVEVHILCGKAGSGKTKKAHDEAPNIFTANCGENFPFDGYDGEKELLLDDFYGNIKYHEILRILDGHQYRVNVKGGHRYAKWNKIYITSNIGPEEWYKVGLTPALKRRISSVTWFRNEDGGNNGPVLNIDDYCKKMEKEQEEIEFGDITVDFD